ncbi:hypothetical protein QFC22_001918 [Naganishia vaughanmartiniae]|uniref:Uncharacterized protein n=1 Tax=Naganishia vaughanmartiniae TaxID=1424756 RepID=A0ACC2XGH3_9TREE|nr:hypothetical protein QFC22_001918 [Naganishia vaughanmartiniae]
MGFLKSLSKSIKRSALQPSINDISDVSEFGTIDTKTSVKEEHAGIKRPSGQGDIARRGRRRSSEKQAVLADDGLGIRDETASVNTLSFVHIEGHAEFIHHPSLFLQQTLQLVHSPGTSDPISPGQPEFTDAQETLPANHRISPRPTEVNLSSPVSNFTALRTVAPSVLPRGIIITPSSPIKPASQRNNTSINNSPNSRPPGTFVIEDSGQSSLGMLRKDPSISSRILLDRSESSGTVHDLGIGQPSKARRPAFFSESPPQSYTRSGLLTPEPLLFAAPAGHRSASLPIDSHSTALPLSPATGPSSPRFRFADDTWSDSERRRKPPIDRKVIRKTRSFSEVLSRNRKSRFDNKDSSTPQPIITWGSDRKLHVVETPDTTTPPLTSQTSSPKKKSSSILKTAVDFFQFRKSRSRANSHAEKDIPLSMSPGNRDGLDLVFNGNDMPEGDDAGLTTMLSSLPIPNDPSKLAKLGRERNFRSSPDCFDNDDRVIGLWNSPSFPHGRNADSSAATTASPSPMSQSPAPSAFEESLTVDTLSSTRAKASGSNDSPFKRPIMGSRAQSANSASQNNTMFPAAEVKSSFWYGGRPLGEAAVSRSTTIRAVRSSSSHPSSDVVTTSISSSLRNSRQSSVEDMAAGGSEPMSILRPRIPVHIPSAQVVGSPTVSFAGGTPRMSISSTGSDAESGKGTSRPRGYTSVSQDNIHNALSLPSANIKPSRPRSSTLFSTTPGWLAAGTLNSPEKKRTSVIRRLSAGLIGNLEDNKRIPFQTLAQDPNASVSDYLSSGDPAHLPTPELPRELPVHQAGTSSEEWMAQISQIFPRSSLASFLASNPEYQEGLHLLLQGFNFDNLPLDIALRRFLMEMALPREAQQIDRSIYDAYAASPDGNGFHAAVAAGNVAHLQVPSSKWIPKNDPMSYSGRWTTIDEDWVERCFIFAPAIEVVKPATNPVLSSRGRSIHIDKDQPHALPYEVAPVVLRLKVVKVGLLSCKDDLLSAGKKANNRRWKTWSVILTNTQLIFLKDSIWALALGEQIERRGPDLTLSPGTLLLPTFTDFKPDEVIGLAGSAAVFDRSYTKNENTFRLAMPHGLEYVLQASDESELNEWVTLINWSAASKTLNIPTTPTDSFLSSPMPSEVGDSYSRTSADGGTMQSQRPYRKDSAPTRNTLPERNSHFVEMLKLNPANKIDEELRMARNLELLAIISQGTKEHVESLFQLMAENVRRWRAELAKLRSIHIRQQTPPDSGTEPKTNGD